MPLHPDRSGSEGAYSSVPKMKRHSDVDSAKALGAERPFIDTGAGMPSDTPRTHGPELSGFSGRMADPEQTCSSTPLVGNTDGKAARLDRGMRMSCFIALCPAHSLIR